MWYVLWGMLGWGIAVFPMILGGGNGSGWFLTMLGLVVYVSGFVTYISSPEVGRVWIAPRRLSTK